MRCIKKNLTKYDIKDREKEDICMGEFDKSSMVYDTLIHMGFNTYGS